MQIAQPNININYTCKHTPTIREFMQDTHRIRGIGGPFGSGKSSGMLWEIIRKGHNQAPGKDGIRRTRWVVVRNTYSQLLDTTIKTVLDWFPPMIFGHYRSAAHDYTITGFEGVEIELLFRALDRPEQVSNLLSLELTGAWINEAREVPKAIIDALDGRLDRYPSNRDGGRTWTGMIMDTNPPDEDSWWYRMFEVDKPSNVKLFKQPSGLSLEAENICAPGKTIDDYPEGEKPGLSANYYKDLAIGKDKSYIDVYIKGLYGYIKEGKPVYESSYRDDVHVAVGPLVPIRGVPVIVAFDFGLTPAAVFMQITPTGHVNILDELVSEGIGFKQFVIKMVRPLLNTKYNNFEFTFTGDPAGNNRGDADEKACFDIAREQGFAITAASSNSLVPRIGAVENLLSRLTAGKGTFQLDPSCKILRKGFVSGYYFRKVQVSYDKFTEVPCKNKFSHPHDALQYGCLLVEGDVSKAKRKNKNKRSRKKYQPVSIGGY